MGRLAKVSSRQCRVAARSRRFVTAKSVTCRRARRSAGCLTSYQTNLSTTERLAKSDAGNAGWQDDLSVSYDRVGEVQMSQGDLAAVLTAFQAVFAIRGARRNPIPAMPTGSMA